ncbi:MAG: Gfo/Idh/MocA family oxidoreductase [Sandarakinorhabdus sp.]|nr:Gfo/Idh/MocA family oxidoreductase [Sandarakinorhabdus sp.]
MALRVGIVSAAWGTFAHLPAWRAVPGVRVTAICTSRRQTAETAAIRHGVDRPFHDAEALCTDPDIDIVDLGTRPPLRLPWALAALGAGKHVYQGVPHAPDWAGACAIDRAWKASGCIGVSDAFAQWIPAHTTMKQMIDRGFLGRPFGGTCHFNLSLFNRPARQFPYTWFAGAGQGVSAVRNNGSHALHLLLFLLGPVAALVAHDRQLLRQWRFDDGTAIPVETNDFATVLLQFANGATITLQASWSMPVADGWLIDLYGENGRLVARSPSFPTIRDCTLEAAATGETLTPVRLDRTMPDGLGLKPEADPQPSVAMALSMHAMIGAIRDDGRARPDFAQAKEVERVLEAIRRSTEERRWIELAEIEG